MPKSGRPRNFPSCPDCGKAIRSSHSPYYKCDCRGYIVRNGKLCPTRPRAKPKPVEVLLSYDKEGRATGVWQVDWVATAHYSTPRIEKELIYCSADEYERLVS